MMIKTIKGAILLVAMLLMAWLLVCVSGTNGSYVPQTWITNFLG